MPIPCFNFCELKGCACTLKKTQCINCTISFFNPPRKAINRSKLSTEIEIIQEQKKLVKNA